jgi:multidrug efflux pump subunit AcrB
MELLLWNAARFEASTIIRQTWAQLPQGVSYPYIRMKQPDEDASRPFMSFTLNAPSTPILIQQYAEDHIKTRLAQIPGIYQIELNGATPMEWRLEYNSDQLSRLGITIADIRQAIYRYHQKSLPPLHNLQLCPCKSSPY